MSKKAKTPALESAPLEPKPKRRRSAAKDALATEPTTVAEVLDKSPVMADILAAREAKSQIEPERPMPEPPTSPTESVIESQQPKLTHVQRAAQTGLRPAPSGFVGLESHYNAGIRLSRSLDKRAVAIQFAEDRHPSIEEKQRLGEREFRYKIERKQWERRDVERTADNYQDAKSFVASLVQSRLAEPGAAVGRS